MSERASEPWLTIIGIGEDGLDGLSRASRDAMAEAEVVAGAKRHLGLVGNLEADTLEWPVPFEDGIAQLLALKGRRVVMLASGDPFWYGAGSVLARHLEPGEWRAFSGPSTFSLAAARLGWPLEDTVCMGLHAAPLQRLTKHLASDQHFILLLRDGEAVKKLAEMLDEMGFSESDVVVMEALGGPRERIRRTTPQTYDLQDVHHPVAVALEVKGGGDAMPQSSGLPERYFLHDGQITKQPMRSLTLSALAPRPGERLWDIGGGSGSIALEWLLSHPSTQAVSVEPRGERVQNIRKNAVRLGVDRLEIVEDSAPEALEGLETPDAVFIGGGLSKDLLERLWVLLPPGTRLVANAVTLESESLLIAWRDAKGGELLRIEISEAGPLGPRQAWKAAYPIVQWSVTL